MNVKLSPPILDIRLQDTSPIASKRSLLHEIAASLSKPYNEKTLPSLLLYDEVGLKLFERITHEPEYYLTETEISILKTHARDIADTIPEECVLVELGAGALRKTALLLDALEEIQKPVTYHALDLDRSELERTLAELTGKYKYVKLSGLWGTYDDGRAWLARTHCCLDVPSGQGLRRPVTLLWLGSSIGNMTRLDAAQFIKSFGDILRPGCDTFIVAIDGRDHPTDSIRAAYLDKAGVTASFALNLLDSLNAFVGYNMADRNAFSYHPYYNEIKGRNEAYFRSSKMQEVQLREDVFGSSKTVRLLEGEFIRFAYSHKYNDAERERLFSLSEAVVLKEWSAGEGQPYVLSSLGR